MIRGLSIMDDKPVLNKKAGRFEKSVSGHMIYANTRLKDGVLFIDYVFAPSELRGTGESGIFMQELIEIAREKDYKVKPVCGFASGWMRKHEDEFGDLLVT